MNRPYIAADIINGLYQIYAMDITEEMEVMLPKDFIKELPTLGDDRIIFTVIYPEQEEMFSALKAEYGIKFF